MKYLSTLLNKSNIPIEYRSNFMHLYFDIGWFGVLSGSAMNFLNVYATRIGATGFQIGLLAATTAIASLIFALPAGRWLAQSPNGKSAFWTSVYYRIGFLIYIPIPLLLNAQSQIWALIVISLLMGIPLVGLSVGFSALFAEAVPIDWRAHVAGMRNIVLSVMFMITSLVSGYLLDHVIFPLNYQIVFLIGFIGAAMSSYHLFFIKPLQLEKHNSATQATTPISLPQISTEKLKETFLRIIRADVLTTKFRSVLFVMMAFHTAQYLALPIFPLYFIRALNLSDQSLGIGTALFYLTVLLGSTQLNQLVKIYGHKNVTGWGVVAMALYPGLLAFSKSEWHFFLVSIIGGLAWAMVGGASTNYVIEHCPENDRPTHLAWYNIILNASILIGSLLGPAIANKISLPSALILFGIARGMAGLAIIKYGD